MKRINVIMIVSVVALAVLAMHGCEAFNPFNPSAEDLAAYEAQRREWSRRETDADVCEDLCKNEIQGHWLMSRDNCQKDCLFVAKVMKKFGR